MSETAVLVTRPEGQAASLLKLLADAGFRGVHCPMLVIEELAEPDAGQGKVLQQLADFQHVIFVSANAVRCGMHWIENCWPRLPDGIHWYGVGDGSAEKLATYGVEVLKPTAQMNSEGLLALASLQQVEKQRILIVKGEAGREMLRDTLQERGASVDQLACYRRHRPAMAEGELLTLLREQQCRALLLSSGEGLHNMMSLLDEHEFDQVRELILVVPGARVAAMAREAGFGEVCEAANATDAAMLNALAGIDRVGG